ncbi:hypothetical protein Busp01_55020 [Trinickia caryophylli]|uniref:Uncharacterized protein n=1 Tax=Trinickia caryophylli TaxID=28094 RepID=A0A1X7H4K0_TRICW|nr:hypothetical protein Busp01_55020 [Trinickia caryophylli]SMF79437.1 hypothetical protein SAMN06295900_12126 [Trinickia caryophylli]
MIARFSLRSSQALTYDTFSTTVSQIPARGPAHQMTNSRTVYVGDAIGFLSDPLAPGITPALPNALAVMALAQLVLTRTVFGRNLVGIVKGAAIAVAEVLDYASQPPQVREGVMPRAGKAGRPATV